MQDLWIEATSAFSTHLSSITTTITTTASSSTSKQSRSDSSASFTPQCFAVALLAGGCGVLLGWHGRTWRTRHAAAAYARREGRHRNPLWLLPAPTQRSAVSATALRTWVAACVGQRWTPQWVWTPALLRQYGAAPSNGGKSSEVALTEATRWGTRLLSHLQGPHHVEASSSISGPRRRGEGGVPWQPLPALHVDVFTSAAAATAASSPTKDCPVSSSSSSSPATEQELCTPLRVLPRHAFALLYDPLARLPLWCGYHLTRTAADRARRQRRCVSVYTDRSLEKTARRVPGELQQRGYDRGHLAPHASVATTPQAAVEATLLTNMLLQHSGVNRGVWRWLESASRAYVRIPYSYGDGTSNTEKTPESTTLRVRRDGLLLARLLARATPFSSTRDGQRAVKQSWLSRGAGKAGGGGRHLCVNVGPVYYAGNKRTLQVKATASTRLPTAVKQRQQRRASSASSAAARRAAIPDAFFLSLWDAHTHHHLHLVLPNTTATPAMQKMAQALAAWARQQQQQRQQPVVRARQLKSEGGRRRRGRPRRTNITEVKADGVACGLTDAEAAVEAALAAFVVSSAAMETLLAESIVAVRTRAVGVSSDSAPAVSLRSGFRLFPVYRERWLWQTRWQRLADHVSRRLVAVTKKSKTVSLFQ